MKKILFTLLTLCLCGTTWAKYDFSADVTNEDGNTTTFYFSYNVDENGDPVTTNIDGTNYPTVEVRSSSTSTDTTFDYQATYTGELTIPATVENSGTTYAVTGLGHNSIRTSTLTKLTIPSTIQYIGTMAVYNCAYLTDVIIEYAETPLEIRCTNTNNLPAFGYSQIETLELDRDLNIVDSEYSTPFYNNAYIQKVIIGENVEELTAHAFEKCTKLTEVTVSNTSDGGCALKTIGDEAFLGCSALEHITIPASVTTFGSDCFMSCANLRNVFLLATDPSKETPLESDFQNDTNVTLYVPRGSAAAYYASDWQTKVVSRGNVSFNFFPVAVDENSVDEENNYYATYYIDDEDYEIDDTNAGSVLAVTGADGGEATTVTWSAGIIPQNTPLLIKASDSGNYFFWRDYYETDEEGNVTPFFSESKPSPATIEGTNMLYGHSGSGDTFAIEGETQVTEGYYFYKLSRNGKSEKGSVGFYWGAPDGGVYESGAHKCWLAVPSDSANGAEGISFKKDNGDTTGISSIESASEKSVSGIYTIQGVRVSNMNQPGLYIVDGKKVLVK